MFTIRNSAENTEIDIIGAIGENWFGEGNTLESVRNQFTEINNDITINISSLGGDLIEALAIHDMFKASGNRITTNIIGATASAGTVIAMVGDTIKISENSLFLGHKASQMAFGNAEDLHRAADNLVKFDSRLINIYKKKTGKTKSEIENWLKEDKWITAEEAKSFGLVDEVYKANKVLNSKEIEILSEIHELPKNYNINMENEKTAVDSFLAAIGLQKINAVVSADTLVAENEALKLQVSELSAKIAENETATETDKNTIIEASKTAITEIEAKYSGVKNELETVRTELEKAKASGIVAVSTDPDPQGNPEGNETTNPFPLSEGSKGLFEQSKFYKENK